MTTTPLFIDVSVVIPFYQKQAGILARALASVAAQTYKGAIEVVVIDDASPHPPDADVASIAFPDNMSARIVHQDNGGPGGARNHGLDVARGRCIAFLDSDDIWDAQHLARAVAALDQGNDVYLAPIIAPNAPDLHAIFAARRAQLEACMPASSVPGLLRSDRPAEIIGPLIEFAHCSAICFRSELVQGLRFDPELRQAGEDFLFLTQLLCRAKAVAVSTTTATALSDGVNIYRSQKTGTAANLKTNFSSFRGLSKVKAALAGNAQLQDYADQRLRNNRQAFAYTSLVMFRSEVATPLKAILQRIGRDPLVVRDLFAALVKKMRSAGARGSKRR